MNHFNIFELIILNCYISLLFNAMFSFSTAYSHSTIYIYIWHKNGAKKKIGGAN